MSRITIYLPGDLRERIDAVDGVNWSRVAVAAFEAKLAGVASSKQQEDRKMTIQPLRASKLQGESADFNAGHSTGVQWASQRAEWQELVRCRDLDIGLLVDDQPGAAFGPEERFVEGLDPDNFDRSAADDFWGEWFAEDYPNRAPSYEFLRGFQVGAVEVLHEVEDEVQGQ